MARLAHVPQSSISKMERGQLLKPTFDTLDALAKVLRRYGRKVEAKDLKPRPQLTLIDDLHSQRVKGKRIA